MSSDVPNTEQSPSSLGYVAITTETEGLVPYFSFKMTTETITVGKSDGIVIRKLRLLRDIDDALDRAVERHENLWVVTPSKVVPFCAARGCRKCPYWMLCHVGELEMGVVMLGKVRQLHFEKRCRINGEYLTKDKVVASLTLHPSQHRTIKSVDRELFFPQTRKHETPTTEDSSDV